MDSFPAQAPAERRRFCEAAADKLGLQAASVEKDFWVCWTLYELFALADFAPVLLSKGARLSQNAGS